VHTPSKLSAAQLGDRFAFYAKRVQSIRLEGFSNEREGEIVIRLITDPEVISAWFIGDKMFPRLRNLTFLNGFIDNLRIASNAAFIIKNILGATNLTTLQIWAYQGSVTVFTNGIEELLRNCSYLEKLVLSTGYDDDSDWTKLLGTMLLHTTHLRDLYVTGSPVSYIDLLRLADYHQLSHLHVEEVSGLPDGPLVLPPHSFRQLHRLNLRDYAPYRLACAVLASVPSDGLAECDLYLQVYSSQTPQDIHSVLQHVVTHANLVRISISIGPTFDFNAAALKSLEASTMLFSLFHSLSKLESLALGSSYDQDIFPVDETIISGLTQTCPQLRWWNSSGYASAQGVLPFNTFLNVLRYYPNLKALPISVDASHLPSAEIRAEFGQHEYGYRLKVKYIEETAELEQVVSQLFPRVITLSIQPLLRWEHPREIDMSTIARNVAHLDSARDT
jgi:hypothetical protein